MKFKLYFIFMLFFCLNALCFSLQAQTENFHNQNDIDNTEGLNSRSSIKDVCKTLNHKLLINVDLAYYFKNCSLHLIKEPSLVNILILNHKKNPQKISQEVYASLPIGSDYTYESYYEEYLNTNEKNFSSICKNFSFKEKVCNHLKYTILSFSVKYEFINIFQFILIILIYHFH